jgi:CubicO group peptidase (beta-lactamase class C family)
MRSLGSLSAWPVGVAAAGVLAGGVSGPATVAVVGTSGELDRPFHWASVTKLCTALAVLVSVEEGTVSLDGPAGPPGATVAHLLAHASGLAPSGGAVLAPPGRRRIYSNAGFEVLGDLVTSRSGIPFDVYLREAVLDPLGMQSARLAPAASPATGMLGTVRDLLALGRELLSPTLVGAETLRLATNVAFPGLSGVLPGFGRQDPCDWGLGFEISDGKHPHWTGRRNSPRTFGHFGQSGGFLWIDPDAGAACAVLTDRTFGPWAAAAWPVLADDVLSELAQLPR